MTDIALDEKALLAARNVVKARDIATLDYALEVGIAAYLRRASPSQVAPANPAQVTDAMVEAFSAFVLDRLCPLSGEETDASAHDIEGWNRALRDLAHPQNARAATTAAIGAGGQAVAVKPLEWEGAGGTCVWANVRAWWISYRISLRVDRMHSLQLEWLGNRNDHIGVYPTWDEAKAAAQADYEHRILSALYPAFLSVSDGGSLNG